MLTAFIIESIIGCALFTAIIVPQVLKKPLSYFYDYPKEVQARMRTLPQYKDKIPPRASVNLKKKIPAFVAILIILALVAWFSGARGFGMGALYAFGLFMVVNLFDTFILDMIWFCHSSRIRLPGTEDMVKEYNSIRKYWLDLVKGTGIGLAVALIAGLLVMLFGQFA